MGKDTGISWTDHTFNPWWGCTKVSPGCDHCYAEIVDSRYSESSHWGKGSPRRTFGEKHWNEPLKWNAQAIADGTRPRVFCASMGDVNDDEAPEGERERLHRLINATPSLFWLLLTKRPSRFLRYLPSNGFAHDNVMLMATVEMQEFYAPRTNALHTAASVLHTRNDLLRRNAKPILTGISYEPALGPSIHPPVPRNTAPLGDLWR